MERTTFRSDILDTVAGVTHRTGEIPRQETDPTSGLVMFHFSGADAPEAAQQFQTDAHLQSYLSAKRTVHRLFRQARQGYSKP